MKLSAIIGIALLIASVMVVVLSTSKETYIQKKDAQVMKYVEESTNLLEQEDIKGAIKFAKLAIVVDPKNKKGFKALEAALEYKYKPSEDDAQENNQENESPTSETEDEEDEDMGC